MRRLVCVFLNIQAMPTRISREYYYYYQDWNREEVATMSSGGAKQLSGGSFSIYMYMYRNCPRCGDGNVSAEFGSAKSAMWWCGV